MVSFFKIFKQAYRLTKEHSFLWIFGLFLVFNLAFALAQSFLTNPDAFLGIRFIITAFLVVISLRAQAGSIIAIKALLEKQKTSIKIAWEHSRLFYFRIFYNQLLILLILLVVGIVISVPVAHFIQLHQLTQAWVLGSLGGLIFLAVLIPLWLVINLSPMFIVFFDLSVQESLDKSLGLIREFLLQVLGFGAIVLILQLLPVVFLSLLAYYNHGLAVNIIGSIIVCLAYIFIYIFIQATWILLFKELVKPQKFEVEESVVMPEIIG